MGGSSGLCYVYSALCDIVQLYVHIDIAGADTSSSLSESSVRVIRIKSIHIQMSTLLDNIFM